jgi:hypothetical protein
MLRLMPLWMALAAGCSLWLPPEPTHTIRQTVVPVACGTCVFKMDGSKGCYWAIEIEGVVFPVDGVVPEDHMPHGPAGMCVQPRRAVVSGDVLHRQFRATHFELLPVDVNKDGEPNVHEHVH